MNSASPSRPRTGSRRARPPVRPFVPVAGPNRSRRRSDSAGHHRPYAARRARSDQRGPAADLPLDSASNAWLTMESLRIWLEHGPGCTLLGPASSAAFAAVVPRGDYAAGYRTARRILAMGEPPRPRARRLGGSAHLLRPVLLVRARRKRVRQGRWAREGLFAGGDRPTLDMPARRLQRAYRTARHRSTSGWPSWRRGWPSRGGRTTSRPARRSTDSGGWRMCARRKRRREAVPADIYAGNPIALLLAHLSHATAAAIFGDPAGLERHSAEAMPLAAQAHRPLPDRRASFCAGSPWRAGPPRTGTSATVCCRTGRRDPAGWPPRRRCAGQLPASAAAGRGRARGAVGDFRAAVLAFDAARREAAHESAPGIAL